MKDAIVKHQISKIVFVIDDYTLLPSLETKAFTQFQKEVLKMGNKSVFKVTLCNYIFSLKP